MFTAREVDILDSGSLKIQNNRHRSYNYELARWMQPDPLGVVPNDYMNRFNPLGQYADGVNIYQYCGDEPVRYTDYLGKWKIEIKFPNEDRFYAGSLVLYNDKGKPLFFAVARGQGAYKKDKDKNFIYNKIGHRISLSWWETDGDTPIGTWEGKIVSPGDPVSKFGPSKRILLSAESGHAFQATTDGRFGFLIHGGRPEWVKEQEEVGVIKSWDEVKNENGEVVGWTPNYEIRKTLVPGNTQGCVRLLDGDMESLVKKIEELKIVKIHLVKLL